MEPNDCHPPPNPKKLKSDSKSDFRGFPQSDEKVTPKVTFLTPPPKSHFWGQKRRFWGLKKVTFGVTLRSPWRKPQKSLFESLLFFGLRGVLEGFHWKESQSYEVPYKNPVNSTEISRVFLNFPESWSASAGGTEGGARFLLHSCSSPDPFFMQQNESFRP